MSTRGAVTSDGSAQRSPPPSPSLTDRYARDAEINARAELERLRADAARTPAELIIAGARLSALASRLAGTAQRPE